MCGQAQHRPTAWVFPCSVHNCFTQLGLGSVDTMETPDLPVYICTFWAQLILRTKSFHSAPICTYQGLLACRPGLYYYITLTLIYFIITIDSSFGSFNDGLQNNRLLEPWVSLVRVTKYNGYGMDESEHLSLLLVCTNHSTRKKMPHLRDLMRGPWAMDLWV